MTAPLIFLPGLGADGRLFHPQRKAFRNSKTPPWLAPQKNESLVHYAKRWAGVLRLKPGCVIVGVSFGGMVAQEMARWVKPRSVILIGSCRSPSSVPLTLRLMGSTPGWPLAGKILARTLPAGRAWYLGLKTQKQHELLLRMLLDSQNRFLEWTVQAIRGWKGTEGRRIPIHHIHGDQDRLIPLGNVRPDQVIPGGGHTISLTHPEEVNRFIHRFIQ